MNNPFSGKSEFDSYASSYDQALHQGISLSGENKEFFAEGRLLWLAGRLKELEWAPTTAMDYGCGTGSATPYFFSVLNINSLIGVDSSLQSLEEAKRTHSPEQTQFLSFRDYVPSEDLDLCFCNGVFHHIEPYERDYAVNYLYRSLRPGGILAFWENNPWNPGTRIVMSRIPFDRDAKTLSAIEARRLLMRGGFKVLRTDFLFVFPGFLRGLRRLEPFLAGLPLGAQYQVLCQKPC